MTTLGTETSDRIDDMDYFAVDKEVASSGSATTSQAASPDPLLPCARGHDLAVRSAHTKESPDENGSGRGRSSSRMATGDPRAEPNTQLSEVLLPRQKWSAILMLVTNFGAVSRGSPSRIGRADLLLSTWRVS